MRTADKQALIEAALRAEYEGWSTAPELREYVSAAARSRGVQLTPAAVLEILSEAGLA